jgi:hypothetical protein
MTGPSNIIVNRKNLDLNKLTECYSSNLNEKELEMLNMIQQQLNWTQINQMNFAERVYFHSKTTLPITINEIKDLNDSDCELDPDWVKEHTSLLINEFADVNDGEKGMMRLWNLHFLKFNFICDSQLFDACELFIKEQTQQICKLNLRNNFLLHLANMHDYDLLRSDQLYKLLELFNIECDKLY